MTKKHQNNLGKIEILGAKTHNLKNISLDIPKNQLIVISGVSGSGKSSLAFNTLFAEGQRRYIESLSSYARQFLGKLQKPDVDEINGITPAIAIEQKVISKNPRSTVGTVTEIYDYLKLLFARIGKAYSPISGKIVKKHHISDVVDFILNKGEECYILIKISQPTTEHLNILRQQGYSRVLLGEEIIKIEKLLNQKSVPDLREPFYVVIDRIVDPNNQNNTTNRLTDSVETAFFEGEGECIVQIKNKNHYFSNKLEMDGITFEENSIHLFSFNNPYGACEKCRGFGTILGLDKDKIIKNKHLSIYEGAVSCWSGTKLGKWKDRFIANSSEYNFPIHKPFNKLSEKDIDLVWNGQGKCKGIYDFFNKLDTKKHKIQNRVISARYKGTTTCNECKGFRLRKEALYVKVNHHSIADITIMNVTDALNFFNKLKLSRYETDISHRILEEIKNRLMYLSKVGLSYLTLSRQSSTLSGGESQRLNLATSLGSSLVGSMYILDEPSIGLHPKDTENLMNILISLRDIGNTVIVVEHDEDIIRKADQVIDLGPKAGIHGGELVFQGNISKIKKAKRSLTSKYISGEMGIQVPDYRKDWKHKISLYDININNISNLDVNIPLECLTLITGVSGSGKSSLVRHAIKPALEEILYGEINNTKHYTQAQINTKKYKKIEFIDQNPIGRSSRSNPVTYIKAYDDIRSLFSKQTLSKKRRYKTGHFSFNVDGGRCEECKGEGEVTVEMQFMADVHLICEECQGKRFKEEILQVTFNEKNIADILELSIDEAINFFKEYKQINIVKKIQALQNVGLGYVKLGQSSSTLSGGESQRIKLASFLGKSMHSDKIIFIFDEPTTGLHFHDINILIKAFNSLISKGHSIICIEHNLDVIKCSDWIIDLGPEGGDKGGDIVFQGTPEDLIKSKKSITGRYLKDKI